MSTNNTLERAIERLYSTFSRYSADLTDRSPYASISYADVVKLQSRPLRELTVADLDRYIRSALITWGGVDEFKHFLPRIFELIVRRPGAIDPLVFEKLEVAEWGSWPRTEQNDVDAFLNALWRWALTTDPDVVNAADLLRGIGLAGQDVRPWLDAWRADRSREATEQIAHFVCFIREDLMVGDLPSYWHPKDRRAILEFLVDRDTKERIESAFLEQPDRDSSRTLAMAADVLAGAIT
jgi:hypothetical protein